MNDLNQEFITQIISEYMNNNLPAIRERLLAGTRPGMTKDEFHTQTLLNSICLSVDLSMSTILSILEGEGLIQLASDEKAFRRLFLRPVEETEDPR